MGGGAVEVAKGGGAGGEVLAAPSAVTLAKVHAAGERTQVTDPCGCAAVATTAQAPEQHSNRHG
jgi:hypothetical protein